ncbi:MAG: hypothetical protein Q9168_008351, partial [Polycauliona sp. 1 TL-2023]
VSSEEVVFNDMANFQELSRSTTWNKARSAAKLTGACAKVLDTEGPDDANMKYLWMDTVCIRQDNPAELSTAINSMYRFYHDAHHCLVYLADYPTADVQTLGESDWFNRGWTLQELLAPKSSVLFYDMNWNYRGNKKTLGPELTRRTGIATLNLRDPVRHASISERMSWMAGRKTSVEEDAAYCLLGIFDVSMPLLYGEGKERAFLRTQEEILKKSNDHTLFAWKIEDETPQRIAGKTTGLLAPSPDCFRSTGHLQPYPDPQNSAPYHMTNMGLAIGLRLRVLRESDIATEARFIAPLNCCDDDNMDSVGVYLQQKPGNYCCRIWPDQLVSLTKPHEGELQNIYVKEWEGLPQKPITQRERLTGEDMDRFKEHAKFHADMTERPNAKENWQYVEKCSAQVKEEQERMAEVKNQKKERKREREREKKKERNKKKEEEKGKGKAKAKRSEDEYEYSQETDEHSSQEEWVRADTGSIPRSHTSLSL